MYSLLQSPPVTMEDSPVAWFESSPTESKITQPNQVNSQQLEWHLVFIIQEDNSVNPRLTTLSG